jgi:hypothetical protein
MPPCPHGSMAAEGLPTISACTRGLGFLGRAMSGGATRRLVDAFAGVAYSAQSGGGDKKAQMGCPEVQSADRTGEAGGEEVTEGGQRQVGDRSNHLGGGRLDTAEVPKCAARCKQVMEVQSSRLWLWL